jgi:hypothetical protein
MSETRLPRRTREDLQLRAIREVLRATAAALPLDEILSVIANMTIIVFDATTSFFMLAEDGRLRTVISRGEFADELDGKECELGKDRGERGRQGQHLLLRAAASVAWQRLARPFSRRFDREVLCPLFACPARCVLCLPA